ncbi:hypothetical protein FOZ63_031346, partial [Perkinsus olseni]
MADDNQDAIAAAATAAAAAAGGAEANKIEINDDVRTIVHSVCPSPDVENEILDALSRHGLISTSLIGNLSSTFFDRACEGLSVAAGAAMSALTADISAFVKKRRKVAIDSQFKQSGSSLDVSQLISAVAASYKTVLPPSALHGVSNEIVSQVRDKDNGHYLPFSALLPKDTSADANGEKLFNFSVSKAEKGENLFSGLNKSKKIASIKDLVYCGLRYSPLFMSNLIPDWDQPMPLLWTSSTQPPINLSQAWSTAGQPPTQQATASSEEMPLHPYVLDNMQLGPLDFILDNELQPDVEYDSNASEADEDLNDLLVDEALPLVEWSFTQRKKPLAIIAGYPFWRKAPTNKDKTRVRYVCTTPRCPAVAYADVIRSNDFDEPAEVFNGLTTDTMPNHTHSPPVSDTFWQKRFQALLRQKTNDDFIRPAKSIYTAALADVPPPVRGAIPLYERFKTSIYRMKRQHIPSDPKSLDDLILPPSVKTSS